MLSDDPILLVVTGAMRSGTTLAGELLYSRHYGRECHHNLSFTNDNFDAIRDFAFGMRDQIDGSLHISYPYGSLNAGPALTERVYA